MTRRFCREVILASLKLIGRKPREEFVFEVFVASNFAVALVWKPQAKQTRNMDTEV